MAITSRRTHNRLGLEVRGVAELVDALGPNGPAFQRARQALVRAMTEITEDLLGRSMRDAPVEEGTLRASGSAAVYVKGRAVARRGFREVAAAANLPEMVTLAVKEGGLANAVVGEVGFNTPYALVQHERLDYRHPKGGKAKYLEANLQEQATHYEGLLVQELRGALA